MLIHLSIKSLYVPALAEGEGVGTAYEYFAKRLVLSPWLKQVCPKHGSDSVKGMQVLIAGLPAKYGTSLDFLQVAYELGAHVLVVDERPEALAKLAVAVTAVQKQGWLNGLSWASQQVADLANLPQVGRFDLALASEVIQRLNIAQRQAYYERVKEMATAVALFAPNGHNSAHASHSGLASVTNSDVQAMLDRSSYDRLGWVDMPPFPPGITRTNEQRDQATSGRMEAVAMWGLGLYARAEKYLPLSLRQKQSHIIFVLAHKK